VLVFSHSVRMLALVRATVISHGWAYEYLDGTTKQVRLTLSGLTLSGDTPTLKLEYQTVVFWAF